MFHINSFATLKQVFSYPRHRCVLVILILINFTLKTKRGIDIGKQPINYIAVKTVNFNKIRKLHVCQVILKVKLNHRKSK